MQDGRAGRLRLSALADFAVRSLHAFIKANIEAGAAARINAWRAIKAHPALPTTRMSFRRMAAHVVLPWTYRIFSNLKLWALGVYHGLRRNHLQCYLYEFVFRFNRRRNRHAAFRSLLGN